MRNFAFGLLFSLSFAAATVDAQAASRTTLPGAAGGARMGGGGPAEAPVLDLAPPPVALTYPPAPNGPVSLSPPGVECNTNVAVVQQRDCVH